MSAPNGQSGFAAASSVRVLSVLSLLVSIVALSMTLLLRTPTVGIVRIQKVLERYEGAIDAKKSFRSTTMAWGANVDTLRGEINRLLLDLERIPANNRKLRDSLGRMLRIREAQLQDYTKAVQAKTTEEQQMLSEAVVNQLRTAAESVAKSHGFDLFLAIQDEGMIVTSAESVDMTEAVLDRLRETYRGQFGPQYRGVNDSAAGGK